ncbi:MAG TPA: TonB-dependent receptor [Steroidobacteraceae bacterium]|nr:TonB-dependent receptor [Steroidobacteraceae bacterium]
MFLPYWVCAAGFGTVHGIVHDAEHRPVSGVELQLRAVNSAWSADGRSDEAGTFSFPNVPLGDYLLRASESSFVTAELHLTVVAGATPSTHVQLTAASGTATVTVRANAAPPTADSFTPTTLVSRSDIEQTPGADRSNSVAMITDFVPGAYEVHDQLHVRGGHQTSWQVDGVEIPNTNIASNLGPQIDPKDIDYLEVERGSYGADEGDRTYGVFNVVPRTGFERDSEGELVLSGGNYGQTNDALSIGSHTDDFAYYVSANGNRSDLGLMTPVAQIIHDAADGYGLFATLIYNVNADDQLRLISSARRDDYQIPNSPGEIADDVQREADAFSILSWAHTFSSQLVLTSSLFYHYNRADLDGAADDYPISTTYQHSSSYYGGQESLRLQSGRNTLQAGLLGFAQHDDQFFNVLFNDGSNAPVRQSLQPGGNLEAAYVQDTYRLTSWLTLSGGLRQTHFDGLVTENATDPRLGLTVKIPQLHWVLRGFWGKYYQAPPLETLSGPLLEYAADSDLAFLPLHGERDTEYQFGITVPLAGWILDLDHSRTQAQNFFDHNPIGNSNVFLPITITGALIKANEVTLRSPRFWAGEQVHLAYSNQTADGTGTITGGLTDFSPPSGYYALDHDQRNTLNAGLDAQLPWRMNASLNLYYGSGFSNGAAPPSHLPSNASVDVRLAKSFSRSFSGSLTVLNLADKHLLIDNSLTFDGYHWNYPRQIYAELRYRFGY